MDSKKACPTVPPLYTWDSGTKGKGGTPLGTTDGTNSLKALALAVLAVPPERDKVGQEVGQGKNLVPEATKVVGQKTGAFSFGEENLSLEKYAPTPAMITHARAMLVTCPARGGRIHCWHCASCSRMRRCLAWSGVRGVVEGYRRLGLPKPYSAYLAENQDYKKGEAA